MYGEKWIEYKLNGKEVCPICGHKGWCKREPDGNGIRCQRVESKRPARPNGWLHYVENSNKGFVPSFAKKIDEPRYIDFDAILQRYESYTDLQRLRAMADATGLSIQSLQVFQWRYSQRHDAYASPMVDANKKTIGIRLRNLAGNKWSITGSQQGLFIPRIQQPGKELAICEGATDPAAIWNLGYPVISRSSCLGHIDEIRCYIRIYGYKPIIFAQYDDPKYRQDGTVFFPGQDGARELAAQIYQSRIIYPPKVKDWRQYCNNSGTRSLIDILIKNSTYFKC